MEEKSIWKRMIIPSFLFILAFGLYVGYTIWGTENNEGAMTIGNAVAAKGERGNKVASFSNDADKSVGGFISEYHIIYNETLGYGGIESVKWDEQTEIAAEITVMLGKVQTENVNLKADFQAILQYAKSVEEGRRDKKTLLKLHRYFHDLDIEFNGYNKTKDYYNVTGYKSGDR